MSADLAVLLAGFLLAHAAWSVSDLRPGELLVPIGMVEKSGQRQLLRFQSDTQEQAIADGKSTLAKRQADLDAWAFAREGLMPAGNVKVDVITVDAWGKGLERPLTFVQRFNPPSSGGFRLLGDPMVVVDGRVITGAEAAALVKTLLDGVKQHPRAGPLWDGWRSK